MANRSGSWRLVAAAIALLGLGAGAGLASAAAVGVSIPQLGINVPVPAEKAGGLQRLVSVATTDSSTQPAPGPSSEPAPIPAELLGADAPVPVPPSILRERNGWLVSDGETLVAVYAGADGGDPSVGRVVIVRQDLVAGTQTVRIVDAGPTPSRSRMPRSGARSRPRRRRQTSACGRPAANRSRSTSVATRLSGERMPALTRCSQIPDRVAALRPAGIPIE